MTAVMPERPALDVNALAIDLYKVFIRHGVPCDLPTIREIWQGGQLAGVTVTAYERPADLPAPMTRDEHDAWCAKGAAAMLEKLARRTGGVS